MNKHWKNDTKRRTVFTREAFALTVLAGLISSAYAQTAPIPDSTEAQVAKPDTGTASARVAPACIITSTMWAHPVPTNG